METCHKLYHMFCGHLSEVVVLVSSISRPILHSHENLEDMSFHHLQLIVESHLRRSKIIAIWQMVVVEQVGFCPKRTSLLTSVHRQVFGDDPCPQDDTLPQPRNSCVTRLAEHWQRAARRAAAS
jgi:hypothetical protein